MRPAILFLLLLAFDYLDAGEYTLSGCLPCKCYLETGALELPLVRFECDIDDLDSLMPFFDGYRQKQDPRMAMLSIDSKNATTIPEGLFKNIEIEILELTLPALNQLSSSTFESQGHVMKRLSIFQSSLTRVPTEALAPLKKLREITIQNTRLSHISRLMIPSATSYKTITLSNNDIKSIAADAFIDFTGLKDLSIYANHLTDISFLVLPKSITWFAASENKLRAFPVKALNAISEGADVILNHNNIANFSAKDVADIIAKRFHLYLKGNPINCNCSFKALADYWGSARKGALVWEGTCMEPSSLRGTKLTSLRPSMFQDC